MAYSFIAGTNVALLAEGSSLLLVKRYIHAKKVVLETAIKNLSFHPPTVVYELEAAGDRLEACDCSVVL